MITYDNGVFRLGNEEFCYLFRVTEHGQLEHLHFGLPVKAEDAAADDAAAEDEKAAEAADEEEPVAEPVAEVATEEPVAEAVAEEPAATEEVTE